MYKALILDLDGTLLRKDKSLSSFTISTLLEAKKRGFLLGFATARSQRAAKPYVDALCPDFCIYSNGALSQGKDKILYSRMIPTESANALFYLLSGNSLCTKITTETSEGYFSDYITDDPAYMHGSSHDFSIPLNLPAYKITAEFTDPSLGEALIHRFPQLSVHRFKGEDWHLFTHPEATKYLALSQSLSHFSISFSECIAFGDDKIDEEMMIHAGLGIAMKNAISSCKEKADFICLSNEEDGVANWVLENLFSPNSTLVK